MTSGLDLLRADIAAKRDQLSPRLRQIAEFALRNPNDMSLETIAVIAGRAGVPPSSLIRFAQAFGYDGFAAMQRVFREQLVERTADYAERIRSLRRLDLSSGPATVLDRLTAAGIGALEHLRGTTPPEQIERAVALLAGAPAIHVIGQRRAFAVAVYLAYAIGQLGLRIHLLDGVGGMTAHQASLIDPRDALIAISFAPYAAETLEVCRSAAERGVGIVALTDSALSPLLQLARVAFEVEDAELQGFRALSATMCLALTLIVRLGQTVEGKARPRHAARRRAGPSMR
ncbi:MAG: MurR/RpiR family transcriptional regulator [Geminicoccaceae bacterium]